MFFFSKISKNNYKSYIEPINLTYYWNGFNDVLTLGDNCVATFMYGGNDGFSSYYGVWKLNILIW